MKIVLTGGGTGGHFYPLIAVAEELNKIIKEERLLEPRIYFASDDSYDKNLLFENKIEFIKTPAGKARRYFSILNITDIIKTAVGIFFTFFKIGRIFPDVIFGKGGYASFPTILSGRILGIPIIIHESDSAPGRVNKWAGKFAKKIAISYVETAQFFPEGKTALTGNPIRRGVATALKNGAHEFLRLEESIPTILVIGGSQGSEFINNTLLDALPDLLTKYQIIHQTGRQNFESVKETAEIVLEKSKFKDRYKMFDYLNDLAMSMSAGAASLIISRAGSSIFEIAEWGIPSIIIPISDSNNDHQNKNAYYYARSGASILLKEENLSASIFISEINRIMSEPNILQRMSQKAREFAKPNAARKIADEIIRIAISHER